MTGSSTSCYICSLTHAPDPPRGEAAPDAGASPDRFEHDIIALIKQLSRRPVQPVPESELLADLGFDSLQVLELVGELEDRFNIAVPLNNLTHIRTVAQVVGEVRRLSSFAGQPSAPDVTSSEERP